MAIDIDSIVVNHFKILVPETGDSPVERLPNDYAQGKACAEQSRGTPMNLTLDLWLINFYAPVMAKISVY